MSCEHELSLAAYALGTLDIHERREVHEHLQHCSRCHAQWEQFTEIVPLLARVSPDAAAAGLPVPKEQVLERVLAAASKEVTTRARRRRVLAAAAALALLLAGIGAVVVSQRDAPTLTIAGAQGEVQARVQLQPAKVGTALALELTGVPAGQLCRLVVVGDDGRREVTATWEASYAGEATTRAQSDLEMASIERVVVETLDGRLLVDVPVRR